MSAPTRPSPHTSAFAILLLLAGLLAYSSSFSGVFVGDDIDAIVNNPHVTSLWPPGSALSAPQNTTVAGRPLVSLTLAINYALASPDGLNPWGYHLVNLLIHLAAALTLFGVVSRTISTQPLELRFAGSSHVTAFSVALLWLLHPLQTSAVTYVVQRAESLMGLFMLLTLYCTIRATDSRTSQPAAWGGVAVVCCAMGMCSKEVMVVAPIVAGVWVWTFRPAALGSGRTLALLGGLAATWLLLAWLVATDARAESVGFTLGGWTWWSYLRTQTAVIAHYLRLTIIPAPLVFMYDWPPVATWTSVAPQVLLLLALGVATVMATVRRHPLGFAGVWFFLILAPSSSVLPIVTEVAAEHRMYLPLAAVIAAVVTTMFLRLPQSAVLIAVVAITATSGSLTYARNRDYWSLEALMSDTVKKQPENVKALVTLGGHLLGLERFSEAERYLRAAVAAPQAPGDDLGLPTLAHMYLGSSLAAQGKLEEALPHLEKARELNPSLGEPHAFLGEVFVTQGRLAAAAESFDRAAVALPNVPPVLDRAARLRATAPDAAVRDGAKAVQHAERAVQITGGTDWRILDTLAAAYAESGRFVEAAVTIERAIGVARQSSEPQAAGLLASRLPLYRSGQPLRESK